MSEEHPHADDPPTWLTAELTAADDGSPSFAAACRATADLTLDVLRLRQAGAGAGAELRPVADHLQTLAAASGVRLDSVLRWAGLEAADPTGRDFAAGWGRLAWALRIDPAQALRHLRLTVAGVLGGEHVPVVVRFRAAAADAAAVATRWDDAFSGAAAQWAADARARLAAAEGAFHDGYRVAEAPEEGCP
ncbi:MAG TPA: hypothetical protein VD866_03870 [Urbifossiella sp.]|nr:hypothetical protein [Urbifossiella sp.]